MSLGKYHDGWVKIRLCHAEGRSYFIPDVLIGFGGSAFFLPSFFGPPQLSFNLPIDGKRHEAKFSIDVAAPRSGKATRVKVTIRSDDYVRSYDDGAQLYRCAYAGGDKVQLSREVAGTCAALPDGDFALDLFHHTMADREIAIMESGELWSSSWNLAGTAELDNVAYVYFTTLPSINDEADLRRVAMSSAGLIFYQTTSDRPVEKTLQLDVYESQTADRGATLKFSVPTTLIPPAHLLIHPSVHPNPAYYEVVGPEIVRIAVLPRTKVRFVDRRVFVDPAQLKRFDYVVEGDASTTEGLEAPMREDTTTQVAHLERLDGSLDIFDFWQRNANVDLVTGREVEWRKLRGLVA
jgi:hypothetical protein